ESARLALGFVRLIRAMGVTGLRARLFWRNVLAILVSRPANLDIAVNLMAMHLHFGAQARHVAAVAAERIARAAGEARAQGTPTAQRTG
ncbi:MAG TPA: DUF4070 domain-containing protein, partial [Candidatus Methanoperedens sp.]|nr:DUF4070 domain-containing protein [Candidatus Methanoperedens sp.]